MPTSCIERDEIAIASQVNGADIDDKYGLNAEEKVVEFDRSHATVEEAAVAEEVLAAEGLFTESQFNALKRKIDWRILPIMWWAYGIQQTDKTALSTMNIYGLKTSVPMTTEQYSLLSVIFYTAYTIFEFPANVLLQRYPIGKLLAVFMFCWAMMLLGQAFTHSWSVFMVLRFFQGVFESNISPGFSFLIANWYTTREHNSRFLFFASANAGWGVVVSLVMWGIGVAGEKDTGGLDPWRSIALFLAGQTILCAVLAYFFLGSPSEVRWLTHEEKTMASARVISNHAGTDLTGKKRFDRAQVIEAFTDPVTYFILVNCFLAQICNGSLSIFGSAINQSFGFTNTQVTLYAIPGAFVTMAWYVGVGYLTLKVKNMRLISMMVSLLPPFVALLSLSLLPTDTKLRWTKWGLYLLVDTFTFAFFGMIAMVSSNTTGRTKRSVVSTVLFIAYTTGNIAGSQVMAHSVAPHYTSGTIIIAVCLAIEIGSLAVWRFWLQYQNRIRARKIAEMGISAEEVERRARELGAEDVTDRKNPYFIYDM